MTGRHIPRKDIKNIPFGDTTFKHFYCDLYGDFYKLEVNGAYLTIDIDTDSTYLQRIAETYILPSIYVYSARVDS